VLATRLQQCQLALSDGRLDEAFDLARQTDVRANPMGQELIGQLVPALVQRGRRHLAAGRLIQAAADAEKAALIGGNLADVAQLRNAVNNAMRNCDQENRQIGAAVAVARRHVDHGELTIGQQLLDAVPTTDGRVNGLKQDLAARRTAQEARLKKASEVLDAGDWEAAVDLVATMDRSEAHHPELRQICTKISQQVTADVHREFESGRLDVAGALLSRLDRLPVQSIETDHLRKTLNECRSACNAIESGEVRRAGDVLRRLAALWPAAAWLGQAAEQTRQLGDALSQVRGSPLFLAGRLSGSQMNSVDAAATLAPPPHQQPRDLPGKSFCIHVDGIGSYQVFLSSSVSFGPAGSSRSVDVPLMLDINVPTVTLSRSDDDYFLRATQPVLVNQTQTVNKLLADGDRIGLGNRCRIIFRRPSAASASAVLDLSGARLPGTPVRQVILLDREIIIGPGASSHIRADDLATPVVLQRRGDSLFCRSSGAISINDQPAGNAAEVAAEARVAVGPLHFVVVREQRS